MSSNDFTTGLVTLSKTEGPLKSVSIRQGQSHFYGRYYESPNASFLLAYQDGHATLVSCNERWIDGIILLIKGNQLLWSRKMERPNDGQVANNGVVIVNDWLRIKGALGGKSYVLNQNGEILFEKVFDSNLASCAISSEGDYAAVSTAFPDNCIYLVDIKNGSLRWHVKNKASKVAIGLAFSKDNTIDILTGKNQMGKTYDYSLTLEGNLTEASTNQLNQIEHAKQANSDEAISLLAGFFSSTDTSEILKGIDVLQTKIKKKQKMNYPAIFPFVLQQVESGPPQVTEPALKILVDMCKISPEVIDVAAPQIIESCKKLMQTPYKGELGISTLGELGALKENWAKQVFPLIYNALRNSNAWNERRFAAGTIGIIGAAYPDVIKEAIPLLIAYLGESSWWLPKLRQADKKMVEVAGIRISIGIQENINAEVWVRDAALRALGEIGENDPEAVKDSIPIIAQCLSLPEVYTRKRAIIALGQIERTNIDYVKPVLPAIKTYAEKETDEKNRYEAINIFKRLTT